MCSHLAQFRQYTIHVLVCVNESDHNRKVAASLNEVSCSHFVSA